MVKQAFNDVATYKGTSKIPYNIVSYLINADDDVWKLINYNTSDALSQPNLTSSEKRALIYKGNADASNYRIFLQAYTDDGTDTAMTQLRFFTHRIKPTSSYTGKSTIEVQIISHDTLLMVYDNDGDLVNRTELLFEKIIEILNGKSFGGVSNIEFTRNNIGNEATYVKFAEKYYSGYILRISCNVA